MAVIRMIAGRQPFSMGRAGGASEVAAARKER
jgi:hypothetical protein